jgi:protein Tex
LLQSRAISGAIDDRRTYHLYYEFDMPVSRLRPHQVLAINRGETEKTLRVSIDIPETEWLLAVRAAFRPERHSPMSGQLQLAINEAAKRLLLPAIERDIRRILTERAEAHAIQVFAHNLRALLGQPPLAGHIVMGIDPGFRTGCKAAVIDPTGKVLATATIYPHPPQKKEHEALQELHNLIDAHQVSIIAIGNGTASRETEQLVAGLTREREDLHYIMVNEAGASVYSASQLARAELPDMDVSMRGAVSIARRLQDPLAELVKIDPQSIGIGLYQHDVDQKHLAGALGGVVESVVNQVGVEVNSASPALLSYVAGIGPRLAEQIVAHRNTNGPFRSRRAFRAVNGLGAKAFEQAAGFLRIRDGDNPLDASAIHPESYPVAEAVLSRAGCALSMPSSKRASRLGKLRETNTLEELATDLNTGVPTLADIFEQLIRPGRDPREDVPRPILRTDILSMEDLVPGLRLAGTVRNVVDFGAFVDIGVKQDGLLHRRNMPPETELQVGDIIEVSVVTVDKERGRIGLAWAELNQ